MAQRVELVFFDGCPHVDEARGRLREAMMAIGVEPKWEEWDVGRETTPVAYRRFGSPTILVNGSDISSGAEGSGVGCVVGGAPTVARIAEALRGGRA